MPKMKTNKSIASRFRVTKNGKLKRTHPGRSHILTKKTSKRKRQLKRPSLVDGTVVKKYKTLMCV